MFVLQESWPASCLSLSLILMLSLSVSLSVFAPSPICMNDCFGAGCCILCVSVVCSLSRTSWWREVHVFSGLRVLYTVQIVKPLEANLCFAILGYINKIELI